MGNIIDHANAVDPGMTVQQVALVVLIIGLACFITARWVIWYIIDRPGREELEKRRAMSDIEYRMYVERRLRGSGTSQQTGDERSDPFWYDLMDEE